MCWRVLTVDTRAIASREPESRTDRHEVERYEPLPGILELPGWAWGKIGRWGRIASVVTLTVLAGVGVALVSALREPAQRRDRAELRERVLKKEQLIRRLRVEQRPRYARSRLVAPVDAIDDRRLTLRARLLDEVEATILADARRRARLGQLDGPFVRTDCEPYPRNLSGEGVESDLARRSGRYACVAVSAEFKATEDNVGGVLGQTYRTKVDFTTGRFAYCKIAGQAGPTRDALAATPRPCGG